MKSDSNNKSTLHKMAKASQRENAIQDGYYDGRFRPRVIADKRNKPVKHKKKLYGEN
jgi:hypothetical protein